MEKIIYLRCAVFINSTVLNPAIYMSLFISSMSAWSVADETDATGWRFGDGVFEILMQRPVDPLVVRVQPDYRNHLAFEGGQIDLTRWGERAVLIHACGDGRP